MTAYAVSPTGTVTKYSRCGCLYKNTDKTHDLYTKDKKEGGSFIARIPADHIVTFDRPSVETKGVADPLTAEQALDIVSRCIRSYKPVDRWSKVFGDLKTIKGELHAFDARGGGWK